MKKTLLSLLSYAFFALLFASCEVTKDTYTVRMAESELGVITTPVIVELDSVSMNPVTQSIIFDVYEYSGENYHLLRPAALAKVCELNGFDMLINVTYQIQKKDGKYRVSVKGFPAYYKKIRPATPEDAWMIPFMNRNGYVVTPEIESHK